MNKLKSQVITISGNTKRHESFNKELSGLNLDYNIFNGVNGADLEYTPYIEDRIILVTDKKNNKMYMYDVCKQLKLPEILNKNQLGCSLSHIELYNSLMNDNCPAYLILEDDVNKWLSDDTIKKYLENLPNLNSFDVAMLCVSDFFPYEKNVSVNEYYVTPVKKFFNRTTAYVVTKSGANKLLMSNYPCVGLPADDLISNLFVMSFDFKVIVSNEPLFVHQSFFEENNLEKPNFNN